MNAIQITPFSRAYQKEVQGFVLAILEDEMGFFGYERPDLHDIQKTYQSDDLSNFWIAFNGEELVGTVALLKKTKDLAYIKRMAVKKEYRKQGLGKQLLETLLHFAKDRGFKMVCAGTVEENPNAIRFYQQNGFTLCDHVPEDITASNDSICLKFEL